MKDIKTQITNMHQEIHKDISTLRDETKTDINMLHPELSLKIKTLHKTQTETANTQIEMEKALCDASHRIMQQEKTAETLTIIRSCRRSVWTLKIEAADRNCV